MLHGDHVGWPFLLQPRDLGSKLSWKGSPSQCALSVRLHIYDFFTADIAAR